MQRSFAGVLVCAQENVPFPFVCLLVSGGHNLLVVVEGMGRYVQLGTTLDDAIGETGPHRLSTLRPRLCACEALARTVPRWRRKQSAAGRGTAASCTPPHRMRPHPPTHAHSLELTHTSTLPPFPPGR